MGVRIVTDSSCDLPEARAAELGIEIVPLTIRFGEKEYVDRVELSNDEFWRQVASPTCCPRPPRRPPERSKPCSDVSCPKAPTASCASTSPPDSRATMQSAQLAAKALQGECPVNVVDSLTVSMGVGLQCINAARLAEEGKDLDAIASIAEARAERTRLFGALDTLEHLRKGGRIGDAQALLGGMLSIKPIIEVRDGVVAEAGKVRTRSKSLRFLADKVATTRNPDSVYVFHAKAPDIEEFLALIADYVPRDQIEVGIIGPVIGTHAGPRTIGVGWADPA